MNLSISAASQFNVTASAQGSPRTTVATRIGFAKWALAGSAAALALLPGVAAAQATGSAIVAAPEAGTTVAGTNGQSSTTGTERAPAEAVQDDGAIQDVIVTAQRRDESLSRVGISVTAIGADELQRRGINSPGDLVKLVPGFQATTTFSGAPIYRVRGVGFTTRNVTSTAPVGIYMDEVAVGYPYMSLGLVHDLERVEVLKGPQGTLYGRNATGGLVNYIAAKPTTSWQGGFSTEAGSFRTLNVNTFISGPVSDFMRVRLAFSSQNRGDGYQRSITHGQELGELYQKSARLTVDLGNGGPLEATVTGNFWDRSGDSTGVQAIFYIPDASPSTAPFGSALARSSINPKPTSNRDVDFIADSRQPRAAAGLLRPPLMVDSQFYSITGRLGYALSDALLVQSLTTYQKLDQRDVADAAGLATESAVLDSNAIIQTFSQELRLIGDGERLNWSVGAYYAKDKIDEDDVGYTFENASIVRLRAIARSRPQTRYTVAEINAGFGNYRNTALLDTEVKAAFANAEYKVSDLLKLTLGGRYTRDRTEFAGCTRDLNGEAAPVINTVYPLFGIPNPNLQPRQCFTLNAAGTGFVQNVTNSKAENNFAWRANVDVTPSQDVLLYGSVSRGYKSGGYPIITASSERQLTPIEQEQLTSYEVGTKLKLLDRSLQLNVAGFYYDYKNRQVLGRVLDVIFGTLARIRNVPRSRLYGVEGDLTWRVTPTITLSGGATYLNSKILEFSDFTELGAPADIAGQPFSYTPEFQGNATLAYDSPISSTMRFTADANVSYQTHSQADSAGIAAFRIDGRTLVDGSIGLADADNRWRLQLYGRNLFDTYYWTGVSSLTETVFRFPGMPRELGARATFRF